MTSLPYIHIGILILLLGAQHSGRSFWVWLRSHSVAVTAGVTVIALAAAIHLQFIAWQSGPPSSLLLPPYQGIGYFLFYALTRYMAPYLLSAAIGFVAYYALCWINARHDNRFFYADEPTIIALCIATTSHPLWIGYLVVATGLFLITALVRMMLFGRTTRTSMYYIWIPAAILFLAALPLLRTLPAFLLLKI